MTDNRTTELRTKLTERGVNYRTANVHGMPVTLFEHGAFTWSVTDHPNGYMIVNCGNLTPEQAIAATLGNNMQMRPRCVDCGTLLSDELRCTLCAEKQNVRLVSDRDEIYNAGFDNGVKATLHQLDGLLIKTDSAVEIQAWVDEQWKEYES